jgi:hypothetical protein
VLETVGDGSNVDGEHEDGNCKLSRRQSGLRRDDNEVGGPGTRAVQVGVLERCAVALTEILSSLRWKWWRCWTFLHLVR